MEKIDEKLNSIPSVEIPIGLHQFVMRKINYQKIKPVLIFSFVVLALNFIVVAWHINAKLIDAEFLDMTQDFFEVFNFNLSFITTILQNFFEIISPVLVFSAALSLVGAIYTARKLNLYRLMRA